MNTLIYYWMDHIFWLICGFIWGWAIFRNYEDESDSSKQPEECVKVMSNSFSKDVLYESQSQQPEPITCQGEEETNAPQEEANFLDLTLKKDEDCDIISQISFDNIVQNIETEQEDKE